MPPVKNPYDFLRRHYPHQVIGSKLTYFLSACIYKLPCISFIEIIHQIFRKRPSFPTFCYSFALKSAARRRKLMAGTALGRRIRNTIWGVFTS